MKQFFLFLVFFLFLESILLSQETTRQEADSMLMKLKKTESGADRMELLLNLAQFHIFKPGENKIDLDSAAVYINEAKELNKTINSPDANGYLLLTESCLIKETGPKIPIPPYFASKESKEMAEKAISILQTGTNKNYLGQAYYELSSYYSYTDTLPLQKKIKLVEQSVNAFEQAGNLKRKGRSLEMLGDLYNASNEEDKAIQVLQQALATYDSIKYPKVQGVYVILGSIYFYQFDYAQALSNLLKALKTAQIVKDTSMQLCEINNYLSLVYKDIGRLDMAVSYLKNAVEIARKYNQQDALFILVLNLSALYNDLNHPGEALKVLGTVSKNQLTAYSADKISLNASYLRTYLALKQMDSARAYCNFALYAAEKKLMDETRISNLYRYIATFYFLNNQYSKARYYLTKGIGLTEKMNYENGRIRNLELLYKLDSVQGNFKSALNYILQYKQKTDSVSSEKKASQFQIMNVEYEVGMKEDSIKLKDKDILLLTQKNSLQQANLKHASLMKNITLAGIILALLIAGLLYRLYRQKQKSNRLLQLQKEEINKNNNELQQLNEQQTKLLIEKEWLVKEIHHRVKNNLQMVVSLLNAQTEFLTHPSAIDAIKESRERMQAIAIIHQKLYNADNTAEVNMQSYIHELVDNIKHSFADSDRIVFKIDIDDVGLDISQSVPLGLILNEAITNAVKYAYTANESGAIQISLKQYDSDKLQLKITDKGKGLPQGINTNQSNSLGLQLIKLFSEQLEGELYFINNNGLEIILNFKTTEYKNLDLVKATA